MPWTYICRTATPQTINMLLDRIDIEYEAMKQAMRLYPNAVKEELQKAYQKIAPEIVERALPNVPVLTETLKGTVRATATKTAANVRAGTPGRVPWAATAHWGRKKFPWGERQWLSKHNRFIWDVGYPKGRIKDGVAPWIMKEMIDAVNKVAKEISRESVLPSGDIERYSGGTWSLEAPFEPSDPTGILNAPRISLGIG